MPGALRPQVASAGRIPPFRRVGFVIIPIKASKKQQVPL
jgi:hypothetical protein